MAKYMGVDVGGSHVEGILIDSKLRTIKSMREDIENRRKSAYMESLDEIMKELSSKGLKGIGAGVPGPVKNGVMFWSCNTKFLEHTDFRKLLSKWSRSVTVDNDVNCMAFGEMVSRKVKNLVAITLGTGAGGGIVIDGRLHNKRPYAGEVGHMSIDPRGVKCTCGSNGCWQEYVGSRGLDKLSVKHLLRKYRPDEINFMAGNGDKRAIRVWEDYGRLVGVGLANLANILDPEVMVLGGGISDAFGLFEKSMKSEMRKQLHMKPPKVVKARQGAVAFGAACLAAKS